MELVGILVRICVLVVLVSVQCGRCDSKEYDRFDEIEEIYNSIDGDNCRSKAKGEMYLREDLVTQIPKFNNLKTQVWYKNRTLLIHLHNMALNRAFYYSYIYQKLNDSSSFLIQPNWMYMYFSVAADVNANPFGIHASAIVFDNHCSYPNWYTTTPFNKTMPFFGPKAWRREVYNDQDNYFREPTRKVAEVTDIGAGYNYNYSNANYKMNPWYEKWMPDLDRNMDSLTKSTYVVGLRYSNMTGHFVTEDYQSFTFFGPPSPGQREEDDQKLPVTFTKPYFDCGFSDKWVVSATSPVVEYMPRYSLWTRLRRPRTVAVIVMDIDWDMIDFNACPVSEGNPGPSYLSGISRCKKTTECKPKPGYGFMRGGYECVCKSGKRYPVYLDTPFQGDNIEQATDEEYENGFDCTDVNSINGWLPERLQQDLIWNRTVHVTGGPGRNLEADLVNKLLNKEFKDSKVLPIVDSVEEAIIEGGQGKGPIIKRDADNVLGGANFRSRTLKSLNATTRVEMNIKHYGPENKQRRIRYKPRPSPRYSKTKSPKTRAQKLKLLSRKKRASTYDDVVFEKMMSIFRQQQAVNSKTCSQMSDASKSMPGSVAYGVDSQFESEARTALRLAHFLSNFLQNTSPDENFGNLDGGGRLNVEHVFGEVISNVMGNYKILSSGVFFDTNQFINPDESVREYFGPLAFSKDGGTYAIDTAGFAKAYVHEDWYSTVKARWLTNPQDLKTYKVRPMIRSNHNGGRHIKFDHFPVSYKAVEYKDGYWTNPRFKCDGRVDDWVVTYVVPFFGLDGIGKSPRFKGVVTVDVPLVLLELNQCPQPSHVANAFKNTARCHLQSTKCTPQAGFKFMRGSYRCECKEGFEYIDLDGKFWMEGSLVELEYEKKKNGVFSRYDDLRCRIAG